jgi:hypothetical protein
MGDLGRFFMVVLVGNQSHHRKAFPNVCAIVHSFSMKPLILILGLLIMAAPAYAQAENAAQTAGELQDVYDNWRASMVRKDAGLWKRYTSTTKQIKVRNRIWSERRPFPQTVFRLADCAPGYWEAPSDESAGARPHLPSPLILVRSILELVGNPRTIFLLFRMFANEMGGNTMVASS